MPVTEVASVAGMTVTMGATAEATAGNGAATAVMGAIVEISLFNFFMVISTICTVVLLAVYIKLKRNPLIPSCSVLILCISILVFVGELLPGAPHSSDNLFCFVQAVSINHLQITVHALICFLMLDHALYALHIKVLNSSHLAFSPYYFAVAFASPFIPTTVLVCIKLLAHNMVLVEATPFYCSIAGPLWFTTTWIAFFGIIGMISAGILLKKTIWRRDKIIKFGKTTHFPKSAIFLLSLKVLVYCFLCVGSFLPAILISLTSSAHSPNDDDGNDDDDGNWESLKIPLRHGNWVVQSDHLSPAATFSYFMPAILGLCFFAMYGMSAHAVLVYRKLISWARTLKSKHSKVCDLELAHPPPGYFHHGVCIHTPASRLDGHSVVELPPPARLRRGSMPHASVTISSLFPLSQAAPSTRKTEEFELSEIGDRDICSHLKKKDETAERPKMELQNEKDPKSPAT